MDIIERSITLPASPERVWRALTSPEELSKWFGTRAEMDLRVGGPIIFAWDSDIVHGVIEVLDPPRCFAYRWDASFSGVLDRPVHELPTTLVMFTLEEIPEGTQLTMVESGFASLPEEIRARRFSDNTSGWNAELKDLVGYFAETTAIY